MAKRVNCIGLVRWVILLMLLSGWQAALAANTAVVSLTNPQLENFSNGGAVGLYFSITDMGGQPVGQLNLEHVEIEEDGQTAKVIDFRGEEQGRPVDIVVVFDITESMGPFIDGMKEATNAFADRMSKANRDYRLGLVTFEDYVTRDEKVFTRSATEFKSWIGALQAVGGGDIPENSLDALMIATRFPFRPDAQAVVILITDAPNHFKGDGSEKNNPYGHEISQLTAAQVLTDLKQANLSVFAITPPPFVAPDLHNMAKETGGKHYNIVSEGRRFPELIGEIGRSLASQYFLTYQSPQPFEDGTAREVVLKIAHPNGEGEARNTYQVRGVGGARAPVASTSPGGAPAAPGLVAYTWWNVAVPLLCCGGLLLLARVRISELPADVMARLKTASGAVSTAAGSAANAASSAAAAAASAAAAIRPDKSAPYARFIRQTALDEVPREIAFAHEEFVIGRGEECDVVIPHTSISREHVRIKKLKPGYVIFDLKSRNGTFVNGRQTAENLLKEGMTVKIGDIEFVYYGASQTA